MSQSNKASLEGHSTEYRIHPEAKRYTLRDNAFTESKNGNFQYERKLTAQGTASNVPILRVTINKNFDKLRILTLAPNGIRKINLYENEEMKEAQELAEFYLTDFVKEKVLEKV
ncbi:MAG: DUF1831 domain-containing protein [Atopostipes suicloacalis]|nr:DUF1831 domain-containing protein [Atopostipes suicloacalis]